MSPREALETDPGQRLALVTAYEALESSGFVPNRTPSTRLDRVGTFNGQVTDEYKEQNMAQEVGTYFIPGSMRAFATVSFVLATCYGLGLITVSRRVASTTFSNLVDQRTLLTRPARQVLWRYTWPAILYGQMNAKLPLSAV